MQNGMDMTIVCHARDRIRRPGYAKSIRIIDLRGLLCLKESDKVKDALGCLQVTETDQRRLVAENVLIPLSETDVTMQVSNPALPDLLIEDFKE